MVILSLFTLFINHLHALNYHSCYFLLMCDSIKFVLILLFFFLYIAIFFIYYLSIILNFRPNLKYWGAFFNQFYLLSGVLTHAGKIIKYNKTHRRWT